MVEERNSVIIVGIYNTLTSTQWDEAAHNHGDDDTADTKETVRDAVQWFIFQPAKTQYT